jgi:hypothetical protein
MKPNPNLLLVHFDAAEKKLLVYRVLSEELPAKVIHTEYTIDDLKAKGTATVSKMLGEDILLSLQGTRDVFK